MVERNRKNAGRGFTRDAGFKHRVEIGKDAEKKVEKVLDKKKETKITEFIGVGYNKLGQEKEQKETTQSTNGQVSTQRSHKRTSLRDQMSGIVWDQVEVKMDQIKQVNEKSESAVDGQVLEASTNTGYVDGTLEKINDVTKTVPDKKQGINEGIIQNLRVPTKKVWESNNDNILKADNFTQVKIKKELIDDAVSHTNTYEESSEEDDMSVEDMLDIYTLSDDDEDDINDAMAESPYNDPRERTISELRKGEVVLIDKSFEEHEKEEDDNSFRSCSMDDTSIEDVIEEPNLDNKDINEEDQQDNRKEGNANADVFRKTITETTASYDGNVSKRKSDNVQILQHTKRLQVENINTSESGPKLQNGSRFPNTETVVMATTQLTNEDTLVAQRSQDNEYATTGIRVDTKTAAHKPDRTISILKSSSLNKMVGTRAIQPPGNTIRKVDFASTVQVVTTTELDHESLLKSRGLRLLDSTEKVITPIRVEYNLPTTITHFNVREAFQTLLTKMSECDRTIKILNIEQTTILWDQCSALSETEDFSAQFKMKEQTYRKGNKKVTLYCIVESQFTINRIKYANDVKDFIFENNIWIKPEFYSTQVVSCPGFFVLVHPRITHKADFVELLKERMQNIVISSTEKIATEWYGLKGIPIVEGKTVIPRFHLETSTRKWGGISTEVLSVHCPTEDAQYLKYLLLEAGSGQTLHKEIFVPTGIHLLEGKEVMTELLKEHQTFISKTTSCQIGGFSLVDMNKDSPQQHSVKTTLQNIAGVYAVERMYHTERSGQWTLVIDSNKIPTFVEYVKQNLSTLYRMRTTKVPKLISYKIENGATGYRLLMTEGTTGKVGTYAEALKRRFATSTTINKGINGSNHQQPQKVSARQHSATLVQIHPTGKSVSKSTEMSDEDTQGADTQMGVLDDGPASIFDSADNTSSVRQERKQKQSVTDTNTTVPTDGYGRSEKQSVLIEQIEDFEKRFQEKMNELEQKNTQLMEQVAKTWEDRMEAVLEKKLSGISNFVANKVTDKIVNQINKRLNRKLKLPNTDSTTTEQVITQESPFKKEPGITKAGGFTETERMPPTKPDTFETTKKMLAELAKIENNTNPTDSTHDINQMESRNKVT